MYRSPIEILMTDIQHQIAEQQDEQIYKAVVSVGINVDKDELIRALKYDRFQYSRGYDDGRADAFEELVHCSECVHACEGNDGLICPMWGAPTDPAMFCSMGERKDNV